MKVSLVTSSLSLLLTATPRIIHADIVWPLYSQQCRDDAGPPFADDEETFGPNGFYHDKSAAFPVLQDNGECAKPLQQACQDRPTKKAAYMEGPIDCGNQGWYCRIMPDENWPAQNLIADLNFGHCNTTDGFEDAGYDRDGHCHGSSVDNTYYWWVRDHFYRGYNGRLRCCCGWYEGSSETPMYGRRIANRCDYRRLVTETENLADCRDANEDHGLGFDDIGCDPSYESEQLNKPIPENDDICWELSRFGATDEEYETPTASPVEDGPSPTKSPSPPTVVDPTAAPVGDTISTAEPSGSSLTDDEDPEEPEVDDDVNEEEDPEEDNDGSEDEEEEEDEYVDEEEDEDEYGEEEEEEDYGYDEEEEEEDYGYEDEEDEEDYGYDEEEEEEFEDSFDEFDEEDFEDFFDEFDEEDYEDFFDEFDEGDRVRRRLRGIISH